MTATTDGAAYTAALPAVGTTVAQNGSTYVVTRHPERQPYAPHLFVFGRRVTDASGTLATRAVRLSV